MFGRRPDGKAVGSGVDPITRITPYIMVERSDAMCNATLYIENDILTTYMRKKRDEGFRVTQMEIIIAAFIRVISQMPQLNRFVVAKKLYTRKELAVSFVVLKERSASHIVETTLKILFDPSDTIYDVVNRIRKLVEENKEIENKNGTDKLVGFLLGIPGLLSFSVGFLKLLDRFGCLPKKIIDVSPFHTSIFITNMGSIKMDHIHHHVYNFGTTSLFFGIGKRETRVRLKRDGTLEGKWYMPIGAVNDERIAPGGTMALGFSMFKSLLRTPEKLEQPPEKVLYDLGLEYHVPKPEVSS